MKKLLNPKSNFLYSLKNFWFGLQLLIVSVSLPVMSFVQVAHTGSNSKQLEKVNNDSFTNGQTDNQNRAEKTITLNS